MTEVMISKEENMVDYIDNRKPTPQDPGMPSIMTLPDDTILNIFNIVYDVSSRSVLNLAVVCTYWYRLARYVQSQRLSINLDRKTPFKRLDAIISSNLLLAVRTLHVIGARHVQDADTIVSHLSIVVPQMTGLRDIIWEGSPIPEPIHRYLRREHRLRLHLILTCDIYKDDRACVLLKSLASSPNLVSIAVGMSYSQGSACLEITQPLKRVLLSCTRLSKLSLNLSEIMYDNYLDLPPDRHCGIGLSNGQRPPPLEEINIESYTWGVLENRERYPPGWDEVDYWAEVFDWSRLRRLRESHTTLASKLVSRLKALKEVDFSDMHHLEQHTVRAFLEGLPSVLESISISSVAPVGTAAIMLHSSGLRKLEIHQKNIWGSSFDKATISSQDLALLRDGLPRLEELAVDLARNGDAWPKDLLDILVTFPSLHSLSLCFELGHPNQHMPPSCRPYVTASTASKLFSYLLEHPYRKPSRLSRVQVSSCRSSQPPTFLFSEHDYWPEENSTIIVCETVYPESNNEFTVTCPNLSYSGNEILQRVLDNPQIPSTSRPDTVSFRVALEGPLSFEDWMKYYVRGLMYDLYSALNL
jgi:hypothetical protein